MFGGKRERVLEEELSAVQRRLSDGREQAKERFAELTASCAQMEKSLRQIEENMDCAARLEPEERTEAVDLHNAMIEAHNAVESFGANHAVFLSQLKKQNEQTTELIERQRALQAPVLAASEAEAGLRDTHELLKENAARMQKDARSMGVLALHAAIEAGRMGQDGAAFIGAAEEIRQTAEKYEADAKEVCERLEAAGEQLAGLKEQLTALEGLVKEALMFTGKLCSGSIQTISSYEAGQIDLRNSIPFEAVTESAGKRQSGDELARIRKETEEELKKVQAELRQQRECAGGLEDIFRALG